MTIGLDTFREPGDLHLHRMLIQPFRPGGGGYATIRGPHARDDESA